MPGSVAETMTPQWPPNRAVARVVLRCTHCMPSTSWADWHQRRPAHARLRWVEPSRSQHSHAVNSRGSGGRGAMHFAASGRSDCSWILQNHHKQYIEWLAMLSIARDKGTRFMGFLKREPTSESRSRRRGVRLAAAHTAGAIESGALGSGVWPLPGRRTLYHLGFAWMMKHEAPPGFEVHPEFPLSLESRRIDQLIRRTGDRTHDHEAGILRGLWPHLGRDTLLDFKGPSRGFRAGELARLVSYGYEYISSHGDAYGALSRLTLVLVVPKMTPTLAREIAWLGLRRQRLRGGLRPARREQVHYFRRLSRPSIPAREESATFYSGRETRPRSRPANAGLATRGCVHGRHPKPGRYRRAVRKARRGAPARCDPAPLRARAAPRWPRPRAGTRPLQARASASPASTPSSASPASTPSSSSASFALFRRMSGTISATSSTAHSRRLSSPARPIDARRLAPVGHGRYFGTRAGGMAVPCSLSPGNAYPRFPPRRQRRQSD